MSDIFISYAREDAAIADALACRLEGLGWRVFVDRSSIPAGPLFEDSIDAALQETRCVLVLWSDNSVGSEWVRNEAHEGLDRQILVPVILRDGLRLPLAFRRRQTRALFDWNRSDAIPQQLLGDLIRLLGDPPSRSSNWAPTEPSRTSQGKASTSTPPEGVIVPVSQRGAMHATEPGGQFDLEDLDGDGWVSIPGGTFTMGDVDQFDSRPHRVTLSPFKISRFPVTNEQYWGGVQAGSVKPPNHWPRGVIPAEIKKHPVVNVAWHDASRFAEWLTRRVLSTSGGIVQLPTEAQWEFVARGTEGRTYPWGDGEPTPARANFGSKVGSTTPVSAYAAGATPLGVHDMAGNIWEWCRDWYATYESDPKENPTGPEHGTQPVVRGGSYLRVAHYLRASCRYKDYPESRRLSLGFRVAWSAAEGLA